MAKSANQKLKLLYLMDKFLKDTDEEHGVTISELSEYLERHDIKSERKSLYDDIEGLKRFGMDIVKEKADKKVYYKLVSRDFELAELKLLVDLVQSSKFMTSNKTEKLISKLESLTSRYQAVELQRQVHIINRIKNPNEKIYMYVDALHSAIHNDTQVEFQYTYWNLKKELVPRHDGKLYRVSPWALTWDDENYYLVGYDEEADKIKHFRVDKMLSLENISEPRNGRELFEDFDIASYAKKTFNMYDGKEDTVKLKVHNSMVGVILDRFGTDVMLIPVKGEEYFTVNVGVNVSDLFVGWIIGLGERVEVIAPQSLRDQIKQIGKKLVERY